MTSKREEWIDYIKLFACVLVVLGHFFQSMVKAEIILDNNIDEWFNTTIYYFHVPLFFICSGYLYQKYSRVDNFDSWKSNVLKKAVALGVPYFVFSFATWLLKTVFSGEVNNHIDGLGYTLFVHPTSPYWYLYILFLVFVVVPTIKTKRGIVVITVIALLGKALSMILGGVLRFTNLCHIGHVIKSHLVCSGNGNSLWKFTKHVFKSCRSDIGICFCNYQFVCVEVRKCNSFIFDGNYGMCCGFYDYCKM